MPISTTYTISNTEGTLSFTLTAGASNGPNELSQSTDLTFYGYGKTGWGQQVDQNFYSLLENFACTAQAGPRPKTKIELGGVRGINDPVVGQNWFNLSDLEMYVCVNNVSNTWHHLISETYADTKYLTVSNAGSYVKLDGSNSPMTGPLILDADPTVLSLPQTAATKNYVDSNITTLTNDVNTNYVHAAGDLMTGGLLITGGLIDGYNPGTNPMQNFPPHFVFRAGTNEGGAVGSGRNVVIGLGATDSLACSPHIDFHSSGGNLGADSSITATGGNTSVGGQGTLALTGFIVNDGRAPTLTNELVSYGWTTTYVNAVVGSITGSSLSLYVKKAGDTMTGQLNMGGNKITNVGTPTTGTDAARMDWVQANAYMPSGVGATHSITISASAPSGGVNGDIWFQI